MSPGTKIFQGFRWVPDNIRMIAGSQSAPRKNDQNLTESADQLNLEHLRTPNTLTPTMNAKLVVSLWLGLVFQLAQVLPAAVVTKECQGHAESCECCMGGESCPCAETGEPGQKPLPAPLDAGATKLPSMKSNESKDSMDALPEINLPAGVPAAPQPAGGYTGVRLSVAFCVFVI